MFGFASGQDGKISGSCVDFCLWQISELRSSQVMKLDGLVSRNSTPSQTQIVLFQETKFILSQGSLEALLNWFQIDSTKNTIFAILNCPAKFNDTITETLSEFLI